MVFVQDPFRQALAPRPPFWDTRPPVLGVQEIRAFFVIPAVVVPCGSLGPLLNPMTTATASALGAKSRKVTRLLGSTWVKLSRNGGVGVASGVGARAAVGGGVGV